jgi:hypothetical protein
MRRAIAIGFLAALLATAPGGAAGMPTVRFASFMPATVRGTGFHVRGSVRVVVHDNGRSWSRRVTASATGTFFVSFGPLPIDRCSAVATAFGSGGMRVKTKPAETGCMERIPG